MKTCTVAPSAKFHRQESMGESNVSLTHLQIHVRAGCEHRPNVRIRVGDDRLPFAKAVPAEPQRALSSQRRGRPLKGRVTLKRSCGSECCVQKGRQTANSHDPRNSTAAGLHGHHTLTAALAGCQNHSNEQPAFNVSWNASCEVWPHFAMPIFRAFSSAGVHRWLGRSRGGGTGSGGIIRRHAQPLSRPAAPPCRAGSTPSRGCGGWPAQCYPAVSTVWAPRGLGWHTLELQGSIQACSQAVCTT